MDSLYIHTKIGKINVNKDIKNFILDKMPSIKMGNALEVTSCLTKVVIKNKEGEFLNEYSPVIKQSCMKPENKTILPIIVRFDKSTDDDSLKVMIEAPYETASFDLANDNIDICAEDFKPFIQTASCKDCYNCGRC